MHKLTKGDWLLVVAVFLTSGIAAYFGLQLANLPMGHTAVVGLTPLCALAAALGCAYIWQFDVMRNAGILFNVKLLVFYVVVALGGAAIGIRAGGQGLGGLIIHGRPENSPIEIVFPWVWILGGAIGATYLQLWTLLRHFLVQPEQLNHGGGRDDQPDG